MDIGFIGLGNMGRTCARAGAGRTQGHRLRYAAGGDRKSRCARRRCGGLAEGIADAAETVMVSLPTPISCSSRNRTGRRDRRQTGAPLRRFVDTGS